MVERENGGGISGGDLPFLIAAMRFSIDGYLKCEPGVGELADFLCKFYSADSLVIAIKKE